MWRILYPILLHAAGFELSALLFEIGTFFTGSPSVLSSRYLLLLNLLGTAFSIPLSLCFFRRDEKLRLPAERNSSRSFAWKDVLLILIWGMALAQYANLLLANLDFFSFFRQYTESLNQIVDGHQSYSILLWSAVAAPISEEFVFRWLIYRRLREHLSVWPSVLISSCIFGLYHGNLLQFFYATLLGIAMAWVIEWTGNLWSSVVFHVSANTWSCLLSIFSVPIFQYRILYLGFLLISLLLLISILLVPLHFRRKASGQAPSDKHSS